MSCSTCSLLILGRCQNAESSYVGLDISSEVAKEHSCSQWQEKREVKVYELPSRDCEKLEEIDIDFLTKVREKLFAETLNFA